MNVPSYAHGTDRLSSSHADAPHEDRLFHPSCIRIYIEERVELSLRICRCGAELRSRNGRMIVVKRSRELYDEKKKIKVIKSIEKETTGRLCVRGEGVGKGICERGWVQLWQALGRSTRHFNVTGKIKTMDLERSIALPLEVNLWNIIFKFNIRVKAIGYQIYDILIWFVDFYETRKKYRTFFPWISIFFIFLVRRHYKNFGLVAEYVLPCILVTLPSSLVE